MPVLGPSLFGSGLPHRLEIVCPAPSIFAQIALDGQPYVSQGHIHASLCPSPNPYLWSKPGYIRYIVYIVNTSFRCRQKSRTYSLTIPPMLRYTRPVFLCRQDRKEDRLQDFFCGGSYRAAASDRQHQCKRRYNPFYFFHVSDLLVGVLSW